MNYPLRQVSIRVPWLDTCWDGRVCAAPRLNGVCLRLSRIADSRDDVAEEQVAGKSLNEHPQARWPACAAEQAGFMTPFVYIREARHPYDRGPDSSHAHFKPTPLRRSWGDR